MRFYYDFHIHSCLSPCGDDDMTPCNIAGMAQLIGLDVIALTDHNSCRNVPAVSKAAADAGITVIPGMELTTSEDVHVVMLFPSVSAALDFNDYVDGHRLKIKNRAEIYGSQFIMDSRDNVTGEVEDLLIAASDIGVYDTVKLAESYGGVAVPAHIDRESNGLVAVLGAIEKDMGFKTVEFSKTVKPEFKERYVKEGYAFVRDSDAHRLEDMSERENFLDLAALSIEAVLDAIRRGECGR